MEFKNLITLINTISESNLTKFQYKANGVTLRMSKGDGRKRSGAYAADDEAIPSPDECVEVIESGAENLSGESSPSPGGTSYTSELSENIVTAPLVGTFYSAPSEDADAFVAVGDIVKKGQTLAIIEAMKLMNEIECEYEGTITEVLVCNGQPVEYGQPLFKICLHDGIL